MRKQIIYILTITLIILISAPVVWADPIPIQYEVHANYPPFAFKRVDTLYGFDLELANLIFSGSRYEVKYSGDSWENVYQDVKAGRIDTCGLLAIKEERKNDILYTDPVGTAHIAVYTLKSMDRVKLSELRNYKIAVGKADYAEFILRDKLHITDYYVYENFEKAVGALKQGAVDVVFGNQEVINYFLIKNELKGDITPQITNLYPIDYAYGVRKGNPELVTYMNRKLQMIKRSGVYEEVYLKYFLKHSKDYYQKMKLNIFIALVILLLSIGAVMKSLHWRIKSLHIRLVKTNEAARQEHEFMRITLSGIADAVVMTDTEGNITFLNKAAEQYGILLKGKQLYRFIFEALNHQGKNINDTVVEIQKGGREVCIDRKSFTIYTRKNQKELWFYYYVSEVKKGEGDTIGYVMIFRDITENVAAKGLEEKIEEKTKLLQQTVEFDRIKTEFFSNLSHELRTPLNIILGTQQLLDLYIKEAAAGDGDGNFHRYKTIMRQNCYRLLRLVNNFMDITKIDAGFYELNLSTHNIVSVVEEIVLSTAAYIENKSITLVFDTEIEEKYIACDPEKMERIVLNLLSNAAKFTKPGGKILIQIKEGQDSVILIVADTGIGIPKDKLGIVFERYRQANRPSIRSGEGSGIGLSIVKSLIEMHNGTISVQSEEGVGTEFAIELPVRVAQGAEELCSSDGMNKDYRERINIEFSDISP